MYYSLGAVRIGFVLFGYKHDEGELARRTGPRPAIAPPEILMMTTSVCVREAKAQCRRRVRPFFFVFACRIDVPSS